MSIKLFKRKKNFSRLLALSVIVLATGCAGTGDVQEEAAAVEVDPYEGFNRSMYSFNDKLDTYVAAPISDAYLWVTPQFMQTGIANFFSNLKDINVVLNDVMQGKLKQGAQDTGRFLLNSTAGVLGFIDVASDVGLQKNDEDFDQTLAVWGVPSGPYLVLPLLGPSTVRGLPGSAFDIAANPATYVGAPVQLVQMLNARANAEGALKFIDEAAIDPYVFTRESFLQYRNHLITDGQSEIADDVLDLEAEFYDDELSEKETSVEMAAGGDQTGVAQTDNVSTGYRLQLSSEAELNKASSSFDDATRSFEEASRSFEEASQKLERLN